jgi:dipeptidyl-peptidase-4
MKRILFIISVLLLFFTANIFAQEKIFTPEESVGLNPSLNPTGYSQLQWITDQDDFTFTDKKSVMKTSAMQNLTEVFFSLNDLNNSMKANALDTLAKIPQINWIDSNSMYFFVQNKLFVFNVPKKTVVKITEFPEKAANFSVNLPLLKVAYTVENNLFVFEGQSHAQITTEPEGVVCGQSVHRNEFGINGGIFWSPDGNSIAFYRMDERMVANYPIVETEKRIAEVKNERYPMAGEKSHEVTLGVYNLSSKATVFMKTGEPAEQYLTAVTWNPDNKIIYTGILNRDQNHLVLNAYDVQTGTFAKTLFEENDEKYVEPQHPMFFIPGQSNQFIWISQRDGFSHLYLYDKDGTLIKQLTQGEWVVTDIYGFNSKTAEVFFGSTKESPLELNIYKTNLKSGKIERLSSDKGMHRAILSKSGNYLLDIYSNRETPKTISLISTKNNKLTVIKAEGNLLKDYKLGLTSIFTLKASDGTDLYCRMIQPIDFEPTKKYPVIVYVYGGPHAQLVTESWLGGANNYLNYLAQKGYIVFTMDSRGSAHRGKKFEQAIFRNLGNVEIEDQLQGINYLKSLEFVDSDRIGVDGWSYGGFLAMTLKLKYPEIFKVAVAGGPVVDWKFYEVMYGERYMDTPETNPEGYANANLLNLAKNLKGKLLLIHGTSDNTVVWQNSLTFLKRCVDEGVLVDYFVYPGYGHNVRGKDRAHLIKKITTYFDENL